MYLLDFDPQIIYWHEQPLRFRYTLDGKTHWYTPDVEVLRDSKKQIVEVKSQDQIESGEWDFLFRTAASISKEEDYEYIVVTDEVIRIQPKLETVKKLWKYARTAVPPQHQILCRDFYQKKQIAQVELGDLLQLFKTNSVPASCLYALLFWGALDLDLMQPLDSCSLITLPSITTVGLNNRKAS